MNLVKTSFFSGISTLTKISSGFIVSKIVAYYVGPSGFAWFGQFQNLVQIIQNFSGNLINTGIVKYIAQYHSDFKHHSAYISTGFKLNFLCSLGVGLGVSALSYPLSHVAFGTSSYAWLFLVLGFSLSLYSLQFFLLAVINGEHDIPFFTLASVLGNLITITLTLGFVWKLHVTGAFLALILSPVISSLFTLAICSKRPWFNWRLLTQSIDPMAAKNLFRFAAMSMTSALVIPTSQLFVRWYISRSLSWHDAGLWQGMCRISDGYLMIITSTLAIYYLPKLSSITTPGELRQEILSGYRMILPTVSILALLVYLFRTPIITLLFSPSFLPMADLFGLQMIGDVLKIGSWLLAYLMLARSMTRVYIGTEIAFSVLYSLLVVIGVYFMGLQGSIIAFGLNYALYWVLIYFYTRIHWSVPK